MKATTMLEPHEEQCSPDDGLETRAAGSAREEAGGEASSGDGNDDSLASVESSCESDGNNHAAGPKLDLSSKATALKRLVHSLLMEVQSLDSVPLMDFKQGIDFYGEVRRFEIALIERALAETGGHQLRAARLLNMKVTTLNSKIKHYGIRLDVVVGGFYLRETGGRNGAGERA